MCGGCSEGSREEATRQPGASRMPRGDFLKLGGAGLVAAVSAAGLAAGVAEDAEARPTKPAAGSALLAEFEEAAKEYDMPASLLVAIGYVNTRLSMPPSGINDYEEGEIHGYGLHGIMALVQNPRTDTVRDASMLTGIPEQKVKADRASNIRAGAALLADSLGDKRPESLSEYLPVLAGTEDARSPGGIGDGVGGGSQLFGEEVMEVLSEGFSEIAVAGEEITLESRPTDARFGDELADEITRGVREGLAEDFEKSVGERYLQSMGGR